MHPHPALAGVAALCFIVATVIDLPRSGLPSREHRAWGNFFCSTGLTFLALSLVYSF